MDLTWRNLVGLGPELGSVVSKAGLAQLQGTACLLPESKHLEEQQPRNAVDTTSRVPLLCTGFQSPMLSPQGTQAISENRGKRS